MKYSELVEITDKELYEKLDNERDYLTRLKLNHAITPLDNPNKIVEVRRNVSKILTEISRRKRESANKVSEEESK